MKAFLFQFLHFCFFGSIKWEHNNIIKQKKKSVEAEKISNDQKIIEFFCSKCHSVAGL